MKQCKTCREEKELSAFYFRKKDGYHRHSCKECYAKSREEYNIKNQDVKYAYCRSWILNNTEKVREYHRKHARLNAGKRSAYNAQRRATLKQASVELDFEQSITMETLYMTARKLGLHVDHIKPISKGGLHHPENLQLLTPEENLKKGAKYEEPS